jgi:hypothetical protein
MQPWAFLGLIPLIVASAVSCQATTSPAKELDVAALSRTTSEYQARILGDGRVTASEYESAILAERACVLDAGGSAGEVVPSGNNELSFTYTVEAETEEARTSLERQTEACLDEYSSAVGTVWAYQQLLSPAQLDELRPRVATCLRELGIDVSDAFTDVELRERLAADPNGPQRIRPCIEQFPGFFAVNPAEAHDSEDAH